MHIEGSDLDLKRLPVRSDQSRMQGLVHILLGHRDIIFETPGNRFVHLMDQSKCRITILYSVHNNTHCKEIVDLIEGLFLVNHLFVNAEKMLHTAVHLAVDAVFQHTDGNLLHDVIYKILPLTQLHIDLFGEFFVDFRLQILKTQIIQLDLDLGDTEPLRDR